MKFSTVDQKPDFPKLEKETLERWRDIKLNEAIQEAHREDPKYVFLEGPPTANGLPHMGHALTRAIKDIFLRYQTMKGHFITPRFAGWDCHGLPVEIEVEKELGLNSKPEIEAYGVDKFIDKCRESVMRYKREWEIMSERIGFHLDMENPYITMEDYYIESVWWSLKQAYEKDLLFKGTKVVPYCARCGTPVSSHEVAQGYREAEDPSIFLKFKIVDEENTYILVWTTTPWTLMSNLLLAVKSDAEYVKVWVEETDEYLILAKELMIKAIGQSGYEIEERLKGKDLLGKHYESLFEFTKNAGDPKHFVTEADFVSLEEGTGVVHIAPAFGLEDSDLCQELGVPTFNPLDEQGRFVEEVPLFGGKFVKDADPEIIEYLRGENKLLYATTVKHTYPFCWRCDSPLLYYAIPTWFIGMSRLRKDLMSNNDQIWWKPNHLKNGRFGNFLDEVKDWALSRNRYWGTPLPVWTCSQGHEFALGGKEELISCLKNPLPDDFELHKPWIDEIQVHCPECDSIAQREPYVIDTWYDSGASTFAQWHYPFKQHEDFNNHFPVDFITEAIDQTRGWFYTLLAISTVVFNKPAYLSCLCMGHVLDEDGQKMSKSRGTALSPDEVMDKFGADATRWYLFSSPTWANIRVGYGLLEETLRGFLLPLWNVYSFFITYAVLDQFDPFEMDVIEVSSRPLNDRWLLSRLNSLTRDVRKFLDNLEVHKAQKAINTFVNDDLSNWWVRISRRRFWIRETSHDKISAYFTLYETLCTLIRLLAPFTPFITDLMHENLIRSGNKNVKSVHLEKYPEFDEKLIDEDLEEEISTTRAIVVAGRSVRAQSQLRVRQPLAQAMVFIDDQNKREKVKAYKDQICQEINVKEIIFIDDPEKFREIKLEPIFAELGPRFKGESQKIGDHLRELEGENAREIASTLSEKGEISIQIPSLKKEVSIKSSDVIIKESELPHFVMASLPGNGSIFLDTRISEELLREGILRDVIRRVQSMRKDLDIEYDAMIRITMQCDENIKGIVKEFLSYFKEETLTSELAFGEKKEQYEKPWTLIDSQGGEYSFRIGISPT